MLNFSKEKNTNTSLKKWGILADESSIENFWAMLQKLPNSLITGVYIDNPSGNFSLAPVSTNPFGIIAQSDVLLVSKTDLNSLNLITECILNSKHIVIINPHSLTEKEFDKIEKLSIEARTHILPLINFENCAFIEKLSSVIKKPLHISINCNFGTIGKSKFPNNKMHAFNMFFLLQNMVNANISKVHANQALYKEHTILMANIRTEFDNGCVCNIILDFTQKEDSMKLKSFHGHQIIEADFSKKEISINHLNPEKHVECFTNIEGLPFLENMFHHFNLNASNRWLEQQTNLFRKTLHAFSKISMKLNM